MRPTLDELKSLWVLSYSRASLLEARQWLDAMDSTAANTPQFRALVCAVVVAYARPFTISQITTKERVVPLKGVMPPPHLSATHAMVLKLRDKVMGHKDAIPAKGDATTPNIMLIRRDAAGFDLHTIIIEGIEPETREELKGLCGFFVNHCETEVHPIMVRCGPEIVRQPIGIYELLVTEPPHDWIRTHK